MRPALIALVLAIGGAPAVARAGKPPAPLRWKRLPIDELMCTRFGPDWFIGKGDYPSVVRGRTTDSPFDVAFPPGHTLKTTLKVAGGSGGAVFRATGLPAGAALDAATGALTWTVTGGPDDVWDVTFEATAGAERVTWPLRVRIASEAQQLAWRAGVGGKTWMDCTARPDELQLTEVDLDGDGLLDVLVESSWTDSGDMHQHVFSSHEVVLRRPRAGKPDAGRRVLWRATGDDGAFMGDVAIERGPDGPLLRITEHACDGPSPVELFRFHKDAAVSAGRFKADEPTDGGESDYGFKVELERDASGTITAVKTTSGGKTRRHPWRRGGFRG